MKEILPNLLNDYSQKFYTSEFNHRYINVDEFHAYIIANYQHLLVEIGTSFRKKPIYKITIGTGKTKVLMWTQMHGNESTGTLAALDLIALLESENTFISHILSMITLDIILMLNPDGAVEWKRRTAINVDMNRDFHAEQTKEMKLLKSIINDNSYHLYLNIHDQRSIFNVGDTKLPSTISLLSPSINEEKQLIYNCKQSMGIIYYINEQLQHIIPKQVSRFSDEYYPNSTGDNLQKNGIPTILFEAGHYRNDYQRQVTRKALWMAYISCLYFISNEKDWTINYQLYNNIPLNNSLFYDIIFRDITIVNNEKTYTIDIAIQYKEEVDYENQTLYFVPLIEDIGDMRLKHGHKELQNIRFEDTNNSIFIGNNAGELLRNIELMDIK